MDIDRCNRKGLLVFMEKLSELISIIVPVYNVQDYLERCINSIWEQTYKNLEIILVDDGSTDNSGQMCDAYAKKDARIKVVHKENGGLSDARNAGLRVATGQYIGYVDSDDWIEPQMYEKMYKACKDYNADLAVCRYHCEYEGSEKESGTDQESVFDREMLLNIYICGHNDYVIYNSVWSKLFSAGLVKDMIFPKGRNSEDIMYTTRAFCRAKKAVYIDSFFYHYVVDRAGSIMNEKRMERMFRDELPFWREHIALIKDTVSPYMGDKAAYYYYRRLLFYYIDYKNDKNADSNKAAEKIITEWQENRSEIKRLCHTDFATKGDRARMTCMSVNPQLYHTIDAIYNKIIIPIRNK